MITFEQLIGDLLVQHNCVIVPSFGGFVAQRIPAQMDFEKGQIYPPRKAILFNKQLITNDGLLSASYAQRLNIPFEHAQSTLQALVRSWNEQLLSQARISIDRVGFLYLDAERNLCFEQDRFSNLLMQSFGLSAVRFVSSEDAQAAESKAIVEQVIQQEERKQNLSEVKEEREVKIVHLEFKPDQVTTIPKEVSEQVEQEEKQIKVIPIWRYVAAAVLLPLAFYSFWIPMKTDVLESGIISFSDFNPFKSYKKGTYLAPAQSYSSKFKGLDTKEIQLSNAASTYSLRVSEDEYLELKIVEETTISENSEDPIIENQSNKPIISPKFVSSGKIIVGSYTSLATAQDLINLLKANGITAEVIDKEGKVRISAGSASDEILRAKVKAMGLDSWTLR